MRLPGDWKWYAALTVFVFFTVLVVWLPRPQAKPATTATAPSPSNVAGIPPGRPAPTVDEQEHMLQYTVQDGDTAYGIARLFAVSEGNLRWANNLPEDDDLTAGVKIWIPAQ